jgi:3-methyl-2-oxobutanoate hydroxymethyltransferase
MKFNDSGNSRVTVPAFMRRKSGDPPLVVLTAYDAATAALAEAGGVDCILVGDSLGMVVLGYENTLSVTVDDMIHHAAAVGRIRQRALLVVDMPWLSYHISVEEAVRNAARLIQETGADAVKLEGGSERVGVIEAILNAEIPVMGHLGLTPQSVLKMGGYKVQGRKDSRAERLVDDAGALQEAGVFGMVLEGIPVALADRITAAVQVPTIGIGAGPGCDGQVLVIHDLLGLLPGKVPKFVRQYADAHTDLTAAVSTWVGDVRAGRFPADEESYS